MTGSAHLGVRRLFIAGAVAIVAIVAAGVASAGCGGANAGDTQANVQEGQDEPVDDKRAVELARAAIVGMVEIQPSSVLHVESAARTIIVQWKTNLSPGTRGPDYDAKVTVDRATGKILEVLVGS